MRSWSGRSSNSGAGSNPTRRMGSGTSTGDGLLRFSTTGISIRLNRSMVARNDFRAVSKGFGGTPPTVAFNDNF